MLQQLHFFVKKKKQQQKQNQKTKKSKKQKTNLNVYWATIITELRKSNTACDWVFF